MNAEHYWMLVSLAQALYWAWGQRRLRKWQSALYDAEHARSLASERLLTMLAADQVKYSDGRKPSAEDEKLYNAAEVEHAQTLHHLLVTMREMP